MPEVTRRQRRKTLSDKQVKALKPKAKRYTVTDPEMSGHYVRVPPSGPKVFVAVCRDLYGAQKWIRLGGADVLTIKQARDQARLAIGRIKQGLPAIEAPPVRPDSFQVVAENWLKRHVVAKGLRSRRDIERIFAKYILPRWGSRAFAGIKRSDVAALLDHIEDNHGSRQADIVLAIIRAIGNWYATRNDNYVSPVARGMRRDTAKPRDRTLDDDELRRVWKAAEADGTFGALIRTLLLCGQRRAKVETIKWDAITDGVWTIETAAREKSNAGTLRLPPTLLAIINSLPKLGNNPYVFASLRGDGHITGMSTAKAAFDKKCGVAGWTLHDLRRTSRSLMSRAGVRPDVGELALGHTIKGIQGVYDRFTYDSEKADALARLAALIETIINPPADNVVPLRPVCSHEADTGSCTHR
jgi:integrase